MTVTAIQPGTTTAATPQTSPRSQGSGAINADFDTFLKMLTTQLQNQDPLDPIDNSEYAVQLATFSGVEQQVKTNDLLEGLGGQLGLSTLSQLAGWVGKEARSAAPVGFEGQAVTVAVTPDARADRAELVARDSAGRIVAREAVALDAATHEWSGTDSNGQALPDGTYSLSLESLAGGSAVATTEVESYQTVTEARMVEGKTVLILKGGTEVPADRITALRNG